MCKIKIWMLSKLISLQNGRRRIGKKHTRSIPDPCYR